MLELLLRYTVSENGKFNYLVNDYLVQVSLKNRLRQRTYEPILMIEDILRIKINWSLLENYQI